MQGDFESGRELFRVGRAPLAEMGLVVHYAAVGQGSAFVERMAGNPEAEELVLRESFEELKRLDERLFSSTIAVQLADCLVRQGKDAEAEDLVGLVRERSLKRDLTNFIGADAVEAVLRARRGDHGEAERLALRAVTAAETTDFWENRGRSFEVLGQAYAIQAIVAVLPVPVAPSSVW
jgi:hypothetical protein